MPQTRHGDVMSNSDKLWVIKNGLLSWRIIGQLSKSCVFVYSNETLNFKVMIAGAAKEFVISGP